MSSPIPFQAPHWGTRCHTWLSGFVPQQGPCPWSFFFQLRAGLLQSAAVTLLYFEPLLLASFYTTERIVCIRAEEEFTVLKEGYCSSSSSIPSLRRFYLTLFHYRYRNKSTNCRSPVSEEKGPIEDFLLSLGSVALSVVSQSGGGYHPTSTLPPEPLFFSQGSEW